MRTKRRNALKNSKKGLQPKKSTGNASISKWKRKDDIEFDDEDAFHENKDRIMLEGDDGDSSEDDLANEVFSLKARFQDTSSSDEHEQIPAETDETETEVIKPIKAAKSSKELARATLVRRASSGSSSDTEVQEESWGRNKSAYYSTNTAAIDSDDEETRQLENAEVLRLQAQARDALREEDFGFLDPPRVNLTVEQSQPVQLILHSAPDNAAVIKHLEITSPETLALAREWENAALDLARSQKIIDEELGTAKPSPAAGMLHLYHQTLLTYVTTLAFYLHLRSMSKYCANPRLLQAHPILARLLTLKQALASMEKLDFAPGNDEDEDMDSNEYDLDMDMESLQNQYNSSWSMDDTDLWGLQSTAKEADVTELRLGGTILDALEQPRVTGSESVSHEKKRKKGEKKDRPKPDFVFDLEEPEFVASTKKTSRATESAKSSRELPTFGEHSSLDAIDSADKAARKKTLRFHTSRIESTAAKRAKAVVGGDDDIPYREREKEKQLRLERESAKRATSLGQGGDDLEPVESTKVGTKRPRDEDDDDLGTDGYYDLVKRQKQEDNNKKRAEYAAEKALEKAAREGDIDETAGGQRSLTRAILKNKGLTPHRSKSVRNPRLKKRIKYDDAKKKIRSQKAVFSGGLAATGGNYIGETSGISSKVVKSIKLG